MAAKAHEISLEAGSKMAAAMKDVINAAAGITGFVLESARDLVQYMVRRGQMTQEEADKLIRQAEEAQAGRPPVAKPAAEKQVSKAPEKEHKGDADSSDEDTEVKAAPAKKAAAKSAEKSDKAEPEKDAEKPAAKKTAAKAPAAAKKAAPAKKK